MPETPPGPTTAVTRRGKASPGQRLADLYAQVPDPGCRGLCHDTCTTIGAGPAELAAIEAAGGQIRTLEAASDVNLTAPCPSLTEEGRCGVYEVRPMVCRLWGAVETLPCPYGCRPPGGLLPDRRGRVLLDRSKRI